MLAYHKGVVGRISGKMQTVDACGGLPNTVVLDNPNQLGQRRRAIAGAADGGGQRRHQMGKGIAEILPAPVNIEESFHLQHDTDTAVAGALVAAAEQPTVDFLTLVLAGGHGTAEGGLWFFCPVSP